MKKIVAIIAMALVLSLALCGCNFSVSTKGLFSPKTGAAEIAELLLEETDITREDIERCAQSLEDIGADGIKSISQNISNGNGKVKLKGKDNTYVIILEDGAVARIENEDGKVLTEFNGKTAKKDIFKDTKPFEDTEDTEQNEDTERNEIVGSKRDVTDSGDNTAGGKDADNSYKIEEITRIGNETNGYIDLDGTWYKDAISANKAMETFAEQDLFECKAVEYAVSTDGEVIALQTLKMEGTDSPEMLEQMSYGVFLGLPGGKIDNIEKQEVTIDGNKAYKMYGKSSSGKYAVAWTFNDKANYTHIIILTNVDDYAGSQARMCERYYSGNASNETEVTESFTENKGTEAGGTEIIKLYDDFSLTLELPAGAQYIDNYGSSLYFSLGDYNVRYGDSFEKVGDKEGIKRNFGINGIEPQNIQELVINSKTAYAGVCETDYGTHKAVVLQDVGSKNYLEIVINWTSSELSAKEVLEKFAIDIQ